MSCITIKEFSLKPGESCSLELPKNAKVFVMQKRGSQLEIHFEHEKDVLTEKRSFYLAFNGDKNIPKNFQISGPIAFVLAKKAWKKSLYLYEKL